MEYGMTMHHLNDDIRPRRNHNKIKVKVKKPWELSTGHKEHRDTVMDNRPKRLRTRSAEKRRACEDYRY
jgi:hypothetical protein